ncbi:hypothetical protein BJY14_006710 [Actinomadura luteofluorescens]|uniref:Uncharacterized protein n=1 Tax=Actinomadura luteofluorescens TaxID=46163 RepID=A0A7Y9EMX5_9ACTN|nr:hypothetical protein [Actinomadura luteofluorescens]NYD50727.1 hypothetical protein [Actinomadura luteofluorescens]
MKSVTTNNALSNGFRRLWDRTKRDLAVIVSGSVAGALVLASDDHHLLAGLAIGLGSIGLGASLVGLVADGTIFGVPGSLICVLGFISVICAFAIIVGALVYDLVYGD